MIVPATASSTLRDLVAGMQQAALAELRDPEFGFAPLLPHEDAPLSEQLAALADWCRGFLVGLSAGGRSDFERLAGDSREIVEDFARIAQADAEGLADAGEDAARELTELTEYVRVGVQLVFDERYASRPSPD
jgi:hypothetical protein